MPSADYAAFFPSLGWLAALMLAALLPSLPDHPWRRHAGWLIAFCAGCLLVAAHDLVSGAAGSLRGFSLVVSAMLLWEFARQSWNQHSARPISSSTHLVSVELMALMVAVLAATADGAQPPWFAVTELLFHSWPLVLGSGSLLLLWRGVGRLDARTRIPLRLGMTGFAMFGLSSGASVVGALGAVAPWLVAFGLAGVCFAAPPTRTRAALIFAAGFVMTSLIGPLLVTLGVREQLERQRNELVARADRAAAALQGKPAARLAGDALNAELSRAINQHLESVRSGDPLIHSMRIWRTRSGQVERLLPSADNGARFVATRAITKSEGDAVQGYRPFVELPAEMHHAALAVVHAPLTPAVFESATAWLAVAYPDVFWQVQRQHAWRTGVMLVAVFAGFCAMGFVLAVRQAIESDQHVRIERVQAADKAKTEFLAFLSHEMRTPLQTILGRTELMRTVTPEGDPTARHLGAIETQGRLLLRLVTDLLDLGTLEAGKLQLHERPFSLRTALGSVEDTVRPAAAARQLAFEVDLPPDVPDALVGDEARLRQILGNLLGNAVKYTPRGKVTLQLARGADSPAAAGVCVVIFTVRDTGPGLPPDRIPQLFTLFTRLDSGETHTREGTGVGLALVRRLCELMGGTVSAANHPAGGAEFTVRLAFRIDPSAAPGASAALPTGPAVAGLNVLVAEDNAAARDFLVEAVHALGHRATGVADGTSALALAGARTFDAVVLDVNLPGHDGVAIARILRRQSDRPRLIGCSAEAFAGTREAALAAGMDAFLEKPVTMPALAAALTPGEARPDSATLFERLRSPAILADARARLADEVPAAIAQLRAARMAGDAAVLRRCAHTLHSTALLANEPALAEICRQLEVATNASDNATIAGLIDQMGQMTHPSRAF